MMIVVTAGAGALERPLLTSLLAAGHDVRVLGRAAGPLPVGVRRADDDAVGDAGVLVHRLIGDGDLDAALDAIARRVPVILVATEPADAVEDALDRHEGWTLQVTTTLHDDLDARLTAWHSDRIVNVPRGVLVQPVDATEVAERLVLLVRAGPAGRVPDFGGPAARPLDDLARAGVEVRTDGAVVVPMKGKAPWAFGTARRAVGRVAWEEYLLRPSEQPGGAEPFGDGAAGFPVGGGLAVVAPTLEHAGAVEVGPAHPGHRTEPFVGGQGLGEVALGVVPPAEDRGQHPQ